MVSTENTDMKDQADPLSAVSACLEKIGSTQFNKAFIDLATGPLGADQCMIFSYSTDKPRCFLSYNNRPKGEARALAAKYVLHGCLDDPIKNRIQSMSQSEGIQVVSLDTLKDDMSADYWQQFYSAPGLVDKVSVMASRNSMLLSLNFYRYEETEPYNTAIIKSAETLWRTAAQLALLHYQSSSDETLEDPLQTLSVREQEVCRWMLKGLTSDAIAYEMDVSPNTVATFRKRAYEKLSINSKTALFALFALCRV